MFNVSLDDVFMQSQTKEEMFTVLEHYHKILQNENLKAAPDKYHFFLARVKFLGHNIERNTIPWNVKLLKQIRL